MGILRGEESTSMILWITSDPDRDDSFIEWIENLIKETIQNSANENRTAVDGQLEEEEEVGNVNDGNAGDGDVDDDNADDEPVNTTIVIEYQLLFDANEIETLIHLIQSDPEAGTDEEHLEQEENEEKEEKDQEHQEKEEQEEQEQQEKQEKEEQEAPEEQKIEALSGDEQEKTTEQ